MDDGVAPSGILGWLTVYYARLTHGKIVAIEDYSAAGVENSVYWYDSDTQRGGHCTPFNTILLNRNSLEEFSEDITDYIFLHESGHKDQHPVLRLILYAALFPTILLALASPFFAVADTVRIFLLTESPRLTAIIGVARLIVVGLTTAMFGVVSWIDEGYAELFALNRLGEKSYLRFNQEIREHADRPLYRKAIYRVRYPSPKFVTWVSKKLGN